MDDKIKERRRSKEEILKEALAAGARPNRNNMFHCFEHNDKTASAWIKKSKEGFYYWRCFTCNKWYDVWDLEARNLNIDVKDLFKERLGRPQVYTHQTYYKTIDDFIDSIDYIEVEEINPYTNPDTGNVDLLIVRYLPRGGDRKAFAQGYQTAQGFVKKRPQGLLPLFNRTRLKDADTVVYVEGEKCVRLLTKYGIVSTTGSGGSGNANSHDYSMLAGKSVILWPDNDDTGHKYMEQVRDRLLELNPQPEVFIVDVKTLELPEHGDAADLVERVISEGGSDEDCKIQLELALAEILETNKLESLETLLSDMREGRYVNFPISDMPILTHEARMLLNKKIGVVYGNAGFGKSLLIGKAADDLVLQGLKVARLQLEDELELHLLRSFAQQARNSDLAQPEFHQQNPDASKLYYEQFKQTLKTLSQSVSSGESQDWNVKALLEWTEDKLKQGVQLVIIDPVSVVMTDKVWIDSHKLVWGLKKLLANYPDGRVLLVAHPNDNGEVGGGKAYRRFCHTLLILNKFKAPKEVVVLTKNGEEETITAEASIGISKTRYGRGNGLEIAVKLNPSTLCLDELGIIIKDLSETRSSRTTRAVGRDLEKENSSFQPKI